MVFIKMLAKGMHLIEFENCIYLASEERIPPQTPAF